MSPGCAACSATRSVVNVHSHFRGTHAALPQLRERDAIVNCGSVNGLRGNTAWRPHRCGRR